MRAAWQYYIAKNGKRQYLKCFYVEKKKIEFRHWKFPELDNWEHEVPGAWKRVLGYPLN